MEEYIAKYLSLKGEEERKTVYGIETSSDSRARSVLDAIVEEVRSRGFLVVDIQLYRRINAGVENDILESENRPSSE